MFQKYGTVLEKSKKMQHFLKVEFFNLFRIRFTRPLKSILTKILIYYLKLSNETAFPHNYYIRMYYNKTDAHNKIAKTIFSSQNRKLTKYFAFKTVCFKCVEPYK